MDLEYVEYPVPDVVEEWAGYYYDPHENADKVWAGGYTRSGDYIVAFGRRGTRLNGKTTSCGGAREAGKRFLDTARKKANKGYREVPFNDGITQVPSFRSPNEASVNWARTFGWWEPSLGNEWLCVLTGNEPMGGMVPVGAGDMLNVQLWISGEASKTKLWARYDKGEAGEPLRGVVAPLEFPELPAFAANYRNASPPVSVQGVLRFQKELRALWLDANHQPVGWEVVKNYAAALRPHPIDLVRDGSKGWEGFENALRSLAMEDAAGGGFEI